MSYNKAVFDLYRPIEDKAPEERSIHDKISVIPLFVDPPVPYQDFLNALKAQDLAVADAQFGARNALRLCAVKKRWWTIWCVSTERS